MSIQKQPSLFIVHCVDTEGPLEEPLKATFERLKSNKGIGLEPSIDLLLKLQNGTYFLAGREKEIADYLHPKRLSYLTNWQAVSKMLKEVTAKDFRLKHADPMGNPYTFSWFLIDIVGYKNNPRNKSVGFHSVYDNFNKIVTEPFNDIHGWHFHTVPANQNAIEYNTCWTNNDYHEQSLCRRLIERESFPSIFRAGGHIERNDLSYWLEQFIPFDFSCRSYDSSSKVQYQPGDINDWRGAPYDWSSYNPCFYDYRKKGSMRRTIFRALDIDSNACVLDEFEVEKAFNRARTQPTILAISTHDRRDMKPEIEHVMNLVKRVASKNQDISWCHTNALKAAQETLGIRTETQLELSVNLEKNILHITSNIDIFGPIPFLAIQEGADLFYRDNPTIESDKKWVYRLPKDRDIRALALAASDVAGNVSIKKVSTDFLRAEKACSVGVSHL